METGEETSDPPDTLTGSLAHSKKGKKKVPVQTQESQYQRSSGPAPTIGASAEATAAPDRPEDCGPSMRDAERQADPIMRYPDILGGVGPAVTDREPSTRASGADVETSRDDGPTAAPRAEASTPRIDGPSGSAQKAPKKKVSFQVDDKQGERAPQDDAVSRSNEPRPSPPALAATSVAPHLIPRPTYLTNSLRGTVLAPHMRPTSLRNPTFHERNPDYTLPQPRQEAGPLPQPGLSTEAQYARHPNLPVPYRREREPEERSRTWALWKRLEQNLQDPTWPRVRRSINRSIPQVLEVEQHLGPADPMQAHDRDYAERRRYEARIYRPVQQFHFQDPYEYERNTSGIRADDLLRRDPFQPRSAQVFHGARFVEGRQYGFGTINAGFGMDGPPGAGPMPSHAPINFDDPMVPEEQRANEVEERLQNQINSDEAGDEMQLDPLNAEYRSPLPQDGQPGPSRQPDQRRPESASQWNGQPHLPQFQAQGRENNYFDRYGLRGPTRQQDQRHVASQDQRPWHPVLPSLDTLGRGPLDPSQHSYQARSPSRNHLPADEAEDLMDLATAAVNRQNELAQGPRQLSRDSAYGTGGPNGQGPPSSQSPSAPIVTRSANGPPVVARSPGPNDLRILMTSIPDPSIGVFDNPAFGQVYNRTSLVDHLEAAANRRAYTFVGRSQEEQDAALPAEPQMRSEAAADEIRSRCRLCGEYYRQYDATGIHTCPGCRRRSLVEQTDAVSMLAVAGGIESPSPPPPSNIPPPQLPNTSVNTPALDQDDSPGRDLREPTHDTTPSEVDDSGDESDDEFGDESEGEEDSQLSDDDSMLPRSTRPVYVFPHEEAMEYEWYARDVRILAAGPVRPRSGASLYPEDDDTATESDYVENGSGKRKPAKQTTPKKQKNGKRCAKAKLEEQKKKDDGPDDKKRRGGGSGLPPCLRKSERQFLMTWGNEA